MPYVLVNTLRTDGHRWRRAREDYPETQSATGDASDPQGSPKDSQADVEIGIAEYVD